MGRSKTYTEKTLPTAVRRYFATITRQVTATEMVPTDRRDKFGHTIYEPKAILNRQGKEVKLTDYIVPPTVAGLCEFLGISTTTWESYAKEDALRPAVQYARDKILAYLSREMLTRPGKNVRGVEAILGLCGRQWGYSTNDKEESGGVRFVVEGGEGFDE